MIYDECIDIEEIFMSIVLVAAMENFAITMGDGRVSDEVGGKVFQEDYRKIIRLRRNICIGFSGDRLSCEESLDGLNVQMPYSSIFDYIYTKSQKIHTIKNKKIQICVVGISEESKMTIKFFSSDDFKIKSYIPTDDMVSLISLVPEPRKVICELYESIMKGSKKSCIDDYYIAMNKTIYEVSKLSSTVNNCISSELIWNQK